METDKRIPGVSKVTADSTLHPHCRKQHNKRQLCGQSRRWMLQKNRGSASPATQQFRITLLGVVNGLCVHGVSAARTVISIILSQRTFAFALQTVMQSPSFPVFSVILFGSFPASSERLLVLLYAPAYPPAPPPVHPL